MLESQGRKMKIKSLYIDIDKDILEINGIPYNRKTIVELPSDLEGWHCKKIFNDDGNDNTPVDRLTAVLGVNINNRL